jgi:predicted phosphodiesterase
MKYEPPFSSAQISRRGFIHGGTLLLLGAGCVESSEPAKLPETKTTSTTLVRIGAITDLHYAEKPSAGNRFYQESLSTISAAATKFSEAKTDLIVELGDFIDSTKSVDRDLKHLQTINDALAKAPGVKHYVLGNHCVETLTKREFLDAVRQSQSHYAFDFGPLHFVVLDACFLSDSTPYGRNNVDWTDANIPPEQLNWLRDDLRSTNKPTIVFAHQRLDKIHRYSVKNAAAVRAILEQSGKVSAVFQGHHHRNDHQEIAGIHYCTLVAMVEGSGQENNGYATIEANDRGQIIVEGFRKQSNYRWGA